MNLIRLSFLLLLFSCQSNAISVSANQTEVYIDDSVETQSEYHLYTDSGYNDTCYSYLRAGEGTRAICYFKEPHPEGFYSVKVNGSEYKIQIHPVPVYPINNLETIETPSLTAKFDRGSGTLYELYSRRI